MHALTPQLELLFVEVCTRCKSCICCRVTPLQKAMVVQLVQNYKKARTLAIGDGANDVSMIKTAHVGIGISGLEGNQAMLASDYSIAQFKFLERLLLVHGRWSYFRICTFLRYFFYKNFTFTLCHFWYALFCGFSAQTIFDPMYISVFNLFYTSLPILTNAVLDQDVSDTNSIRYPKLYTPGMHNLLFNEREFVYCSLHGFYTSAVMFFVIYGTFIHGVSSNGRTFSDYVFMATVLAFILVAVVSVQILFDTQYWTYINTLSMLVSIASYFVFTYVFSVLLKDTFIISLKRAMTDPNFWLCVLVIIVLDILPVISRRFYLFLVHPTLSNRIRLKQRILKTGSSVELDSGQYGSQANKRPRRSIRSGYAFAHQEGFGRLITSGKIMKRMIHHHGPSNGHAHNASTGVLPSDTANGNPADTDGQAANGPPRQCPNFHLCKMAKTVLVALILAKFSVFAWCQSTPFKPEDPTVFSAHIARLPFNGNPVCDPQTGNTYCEQVAKGAVTAIVNQKKPGNSMISFGCLCMPDYGGACDCTYNYNLPGGVHEAYQEMIFKDNGKLDAKFRVLPLGG
ncbi:hypothetical protein M8J77_005726 [Diaphorina citri]|nr:hypothetical protein M8J77_005726 [Diaphorina citri]